MHTAQPTPHSPPTPRTFRVTIEGQRAQRTTARTPFDAVVRVLNSRGLRYAHTKFSVVEVPTNG